MRSLLTGERILFTPSGTGGTVSITTAGVATVAVTSGSTTTKFADAGQYGLGSFLKVGTDYYCIVGVTDNETVQVEQYNTATNAFVKSAMKEQTTEAFSIVVPAQGRATTACSVTNYGQVSVSVGGQVTSTVELAPVAGWPDITLAPFTP